MPLGMLDTAVWNGEDSDERPVGSSGKVRGVGPSGRRIFVDWGGGSKGWYDAKDLLTCRQAANRGIEPWAEAYGK